MSQSSKKMLAGLSWGVILAALGPACSSHRLFFHTPRHSHPSARTPRHPHARATHAPPGSCKLLSSRLATNQICQIQTVSPERYHPTRRTLPTMNRMIAIANVCAKLTLAQVTRALSLHVQSKMCLNFIPLIASGAQRSCGQGPSRSKVTSTNSTSCSDCCDV